MADDDYFCNSRPVPNQESIKEQWIPTDLYRQAVQGFEERFADDEEKYMTPTACPSHLRRLQPIASAPTINFKTDHMMPGFCLEHEYNIGEYVIGRAELKDSSNKWHKVGFVVNQGDGDCNSGHWGGAYLIQENGKSLTPIAWMRSVGDTETFVEQSRGDLPNDVAAILQKFNNLDQDLKFSVKVLMDDCEEEEDVYPEGLFGESSLNPGKCTTMLEKLVGAAYGQLMKGSSSHSDRMIKIPKKEPQDEENEEDGEKAFEGMVFAITGALSMKRADFVKLLEENGGIVKGSVTKEVTHLISSREDTAKAKKAKASGIAIVTEEQLLSRPGVKSGDGEDEDDEVESGSNDENNNGGEQTSSSEPLAGMIFAITGALSMKRADFVAKLAQHGGIVKGSVTSDVTHLISARDDTAKAQKAKENGIAILQEEQVLDMISSSASAPAAKKPKATATSKEAPKEKEDSGAKMDASGDKLDGMVFAITGTLSMKRDDFIALIGKHGGVVKGSVTKDVTHLISARDDTAKAQKAKANGINIIKEEKVMKMMGGVAENTSPDEAVDAQKPKATAAKAAKVEPNKNTESNASLDGKVFAITGALSMKRDEFVSLIESHGGVVKGSVTKDVTHLVSARDDTAKAKKAKENGINIIKEEKVMEMMGITGDSLPMETDDAAEKPKPSTAKDIKSGDSKQSDGVDGLVFAITGALSMKRDEFVSLIESHGGIVKGSVTKDVTHLISARDDTAKAKKAKENGIQILNEEAVLSMMGRTGDESAAKKRTPEKQGGSSRKRAKK